MCSCLLEKQKKDTVSISAAKILQDKRVSIIRGNRHGISFLTLQQQSLSWILWSTIMTINDSLREGTTKMCVTGTMLRL